MVTVPAAIGAVEDAMVGQLRSLAGSTVRAIDSVPANFTEAETRDRLRNAPALYVSFLGGTARDENAAVIDANMAVYVLTDHRSGEKARRRGDSVQIGAYDLIALTASGLHGFVVPGFGALSLAEVQNLWADALDSLGVSLYAVTFRLPVTFQIPDAATLGSFQTFHADWDIPPFGPLPPPNGLPADDRDAIDNVTLPGG